MSLHTREFFGPMVLAVADTPQLLYTVPGGGRARVHELMLANRHTAAVDVALFLDSDEHDGFFAGGLVPARTTWMWPLTTWDEDREVYGIADVGGVFVVKASGSLLTV